MKRFILTLAAVSLLTQYSKSQNTFPPTGKVGIGTSNPAAALDVAGFIQISAINMASPPPDISYGLFPYGGVGLGIFSGAINSNQGIGIWTNPAGVKKEVMRILSVGSVGIGTVEPLAQLDVFHPSTGSSLRLGGAAIGTSNDTGIDLYVNNANNVPVYARVALGVNTASVGSESGYLGFSTINSGTLSEKMRITKEGYIGIGTADTKGYKLAVAGNVIAESMTVKLQGQWPDYVFKKDYTLLALEDLAAYIDENQHLPGLPKDDEVAKEGINLGEMNKVLTKKIEELTLYLIDMKRENNEMKKQIQLILLKSKLN